MAFILLSQIRLRRAVRGGRIPSAGFEMPGAPFTSWLTLGFLGCVIVLMALDYPNGTATVASAPAVGILLMLGWKYMNRDRRPAPPRIPVS